MQPLRTLGPLMLMILLCDADIPCPTELNPLTLDPPVVIGEQGESVEVNCTSNEEDHYGMNWRTSNTDSGFEDEKSFVSEFLQLSDWNMSAECRLKLNETFECSKDLEITVYKNPTVAMYPTKYLTDLVEGTLYELQCDILEVAPIQNLTVKWYKGEKVIKIDTFTNTTKKPVDESSILTVNISREDNRAEFWCEAQLDFGPHGVKRPAISKKQPVSVVYGPEFKSNPKGDFVFLRKGVNVTLNCEAEGNPPPIFNWTREGVELLEKTNFLNISRINDSAIYNCTAYNHLGSVSKGISVQVLNMLKAAAAPADMTPPVASTTAAPATPTPTSEALTLLYSESTMTAPETPDSTTSKTSTTTYTETSSPGGCPLSLTPPEIVVKYGDPASVNCTTSAPDAYLIGWEAAFGGTGVEQPPSVTWRVEKLEHWIVEPKCFLTMKNNEQCTVMPSVTLYKTPDIVLVSAIGSGPMLEGKDFPLTCDVMNVAPVQNLKLKWYRGDEIVDTKTFKNPTVTPVNLTYPLSIISKRDYNGAAFRCVAELHFGPEGPVPTPTVTSSPFIADVRYPPVFKEKSYNKDVNQGENVTFHCSAEGNPPPTIHWEYTPAVNVKETTGGRHRNISITEATSTNAGVYICNATNDIGTVTRSVTVKMMSKNSSSPLWFLWALFIILVVLFLIISMIILNHRRKKNGQYSFVSSKATDDIPMTDKPEA
ncbi:intercellular adhesion molecule 5 [Notolabrus celidotus]|uniref:intercellular adhesion molecule 5 n=1 Tax=Notolabrus celidotus TaxID=1203425 RepID=UPI00149070BF|nr:intercellular adhesion molecule 5 [Notolabrus celidotus]